MRRVLRRGGSSRPRAGRHLTFLDHKHLFGSKIVVKWHHVGYATYTSSATPTGVAQLQWSSSGNPSFYDTPSQQLRQQNPLNDPAFLSMCLGSANWSSGIFGGIGTLLAYNFRRHIVLGAKISVKAEPVSTGSPVDFFIYLGALNKDQTAPTIGSNPYEDFNEMRGFKTKNNWNTIQGGAGTLRPLQVSKYFKCGFYAPHFKLEPESYGGSQLSSGGWTTAGYPTAYICMGIATRDGTGFPASSFQWRFTVKTTWYVKFFEPNIMLGQ